MYQKNLGLERINQIPIVAHLVWYDLVMSLSRPAEFAQNFPSDFATGGFAPWQPDQLSPMRRQCVANALSIAVATAADDRTSWFMAAKPTVRCDGVAGLRRKSFDQIDFVRWAQSKLGRTNSTLGELRSLSCRPATVRKNRSQDNTDLVYPYLDTLVIGYPQETGYATPRSCVLPSISSGSTD